MSASEHGFHKGVCLADIGHDRRFGLVVTTDGGRMGNKITIRWFGGDEQELYYHNGYRIVADLDQMQALREYIREHGRSWKKDLHYDWMGCRLRGHIHRLRNTAGPKFLEAFEVPQEWKA